MSNKEIKGLTELKKFILSRKEDVISLNTRHGTGINFFLPTLFNTLGKCFVSGSNKNINNILEIYLKSSKPNLTNIAIDTPITLRDEFFKYIHLFETQPSVRNNTPGENGFYDFIFMNGMDSVEDQNNFFILDMYNYCTLKRIRTPKIILFSSIRKNYNITKSYVKVDLDQSTLSNKMKHSIKEEYIAPDSVLRIVTDAYKAKEILLMILPDSDEVNDWSKLIAANNLFKPETVLTITDENIDSIGSLSNKEISLIITTSEIEKVLIMAPPRKIIDFMKEKTFVYTRAGGIRLNKTFITKEMADVRKKRLLFASDNVIYRVITRDNYEKLKDTKSPPNRYKAIINCLNEDIDPIDVIVDFNIVKDTSLIKSIGFEDKEMIKFYRRVNSLNPQNTAIYHEWLITNGDPLTGAIVCAILDDPFFFFISKSTRLSSSYYGVDDMHTACNVVFEYVRNRGLDLSAISLEASSLTIDATKFRQLLLIVIRLNKIGEEISKVKNEELYVEDTLKKIYPLIVKYYQRDIYTKETVINKSKKTGKNEKVNVYKKIMEDTKEHLTFEINRNNYNKVKNTPHNRVLSHIITSYPFEGRRINILDFVILPDFYLQ